MSANFQNYHVTDQQHQQTLVAALRHFLAGRSWGDVRRLLRTRHVQVNGNLCLDEGRRLKSGDVVKVWEQPLPKPVEEEDIRIVFADPHLVVIEKPAGVTTLRHREEREWPDQRKQLQPTLDELLARVLGKRERRGSGRRTPWVRAVHRLDRDTSGLMVFARTVPAERLLVQQFALHTIRRKYVAVVLGDCPGQTIESQLVRDRGDGRRGSAAGDAGDAEGQRAVTHVRPLERLGDYTVVECELETGRTHQIRIHMSERGHPVCGDKVYLKPFRARPFTDRSGALRQALHACELGFQHPVTGEQLFFRSELPPDLRELIRRLRASGSGTDESPPGEHGDAPAAKRSPPPRRRREPRRRDPG